MLLILMCPICLALIGFLSYLGFLGFVVVRTGRTDGLRDVAEAVKAYRGVLSVLGKPVEHDVPRTREHEAVFKRIGRDGEADIGCPPPSHSGARRAHASVLRTPGHQIGRQWHRRAR